MAGDVVKKIEITAALSSDYRAAFSAAGNIAKIVGAELAALSKREADLQKLSGLAAEKAAAEASGNVKAISALSSRYDALAQKLGVVGASAGDLSGELSALAKKRGSLLSVKNAAATRAELGRLAQQIQDVSVAYKKLKDPALAKHLEALRARYRDLGGDAGRAGASLSSFATRCAGLPGPVGGVASSLMSLRGLLSGPAGVVALIGGVAAASVAATKALFSLGVSAAKSGDAVIKQADALGISTDAYQELSYAMQRGGASESEFSAGLKSLQSQMAAAASGNARAIKAFSALGISLSEVRALNAEEMLSRISDGLAALDDPAVRVRTGIQLLGGSGEKLASALSSGADALSELRKRAKASGFARTRAELELAASATDAFLDAQLSAQSALREIGVAVLPTVCDLLQQFSGFVSENRDEIKQFAEACGTFMSAAGTVIVETVRGISVAVDVLRGGWEYWVDTLSGGCNDILGDLRALKEGVAFIFSGVASYIKGLFEDVVSFVTSVPERLSDALSDVPLIGDLLGNGFVPGAAARASSQIVINNNIDARGGDSSAGSGVRRALSEASPVTVSAVGSALNRYGGLSGF